MAAIAPLLALLLLAPPARAAGDPPLLDVESRREVLPASFLPVTPTAAKAPPLALVVEAGSGWEAPGRLETALGKASAIFAPCGVTLGAAEVTVVRWRAEGLRRLNASDPAAGPAQAAVMSEPRLPARRPAVFLFAAGSVPSTAAAYNATSVARLGAHFPGVASLLNTSWITFDQESRPRRADESPSYSTFAHELAHLFGDLDHTPDRPNLMTLSETRGSKSGDLTPAQCAEVRKLHGLP